MQTFLQEIAYCGDENELIRILNKHGKWKESNSHHVVSNLNRVRLLNFKFNVMFTLNAKRMPSWAFLIRDDNEAYERLQRQVAVFIKKVNCVILDRKCYRDRYENWPSFFATLETTKKDGSKCDSHFHIFMCIPDQVVDAIADSQELLEIWLRAIKSSDQSTYDCTKITTNSAKVVRYLTKFSGETKSLEFSIDNHNIRSILK